MTFSPYTLNGHQFRGAGVDLTPGKTFQISAMAGQHRKAVEFGDYQLDTWLFWVDILQFLGEFESAIQTLLQASEYFPEENEVEYRLAGLYFMLSDTTKAKFHLSNALRLNFDNYVLIEDLFPVVWAKKTVRNYIDKHKKQ